MKMKKTNMLLFTLGLLPITALATLPLISCSTEVENQNEEIPNVNIESDYNGARGIFKNLNWDEAKVQSFKEFVEKKIVEKDFMGKFFYNDIFIGNKYRNIDKFVADSMRSSETTIYKNFLVYNQSMKKAVNLMFAEYIGGNASFNIISKSIAASYIWENYNSSENIEHLSNLFWDFQDFIQLKPQLINGSYDPTVFEYGYVNLKVELDTQAPKLVFEEIKENDKLIGYAIQSISFKVKTKDYKGTNINQAFQSSLTSVTECDFTEIGINANQILLEFFITEFNNQNNNPSN